MIKRFSNLLLAVLLLATSNFRLAADWDADKPNPKPDTNSDSKTDSKSDEKIFEEPAPSVTAHTITIGGKSLKYHATAGYIVLKEEEGKPFIKDGPQKASPESKPDSKESEPGKTKDGLKPKAKV